MILVDLVFQRIFVFWLTIICKKKIAYKQRRYISYINRESEKENNALGTEAPFYAQENG